MSRTWATEKRSDGWVMMCDVVGCPTKVGPRPTQDDFPLAEFAAAGWAIGKASDSCPTCRSKGITFGEPHGVMATHGVEPGTTEGEQ